ncbi:MAG TPA: hypothetical protein VNI20_00960 [Fimbriimonadaceae bacterium]|nr:hypothetical protein [Fimbriimonadaceae bacterium]
MRRYSDEEVKAILRLAVGEGIEQEHDGLSLDELVAVAKEAGLDPERVRTAAERYDLRDTGDHTVGLLGFRRYTEIHRVVDGEVNDQNKAELVAELRSALQGPTGETNQIGQTFEWNSPTEFRGLQFTFSPEGKKTRIRARLSAWGTPWLIYCFATVFGLGLAAAIGKRSLYPVLHSQTLTFLIGLGIWLVFMALARLGIGYWYRSMVTSMKHALSASERVIEQHHAQEAVQATTQQEDDARVRLGQGE